MAVYAAYHRNRWNRLTHFIGVPAIIFAILIPMSWVSFGEGVTLAHLFLGAVLAYYFLLDVPLALATAVAVGALFHAAKLAAGTGVASGWTWFGVFFVGGWILQLVGHAFERSEEHTSELQSRLHLVCRLLLEKKKKIQKKSAIQKNNYSVKLICVEEPHRDENRSTHVS